MSQSNSQSRYMYGKESTFGTAVTRDTVLSRVQNGDIPETNNIIYERGAGEGANIITASYGSYSVLPTVNFNVNDFDFIKFFVGPKTGAGTSGDPYVLTEATEGEIGVANGIDSFTLEEANVTETTDQVKIVSGCLGNSFSMSGNLGQIITCNAQVIGRKTIRSSTATSYSPNTTSSFVMINGTFKWGGTPTALSGVRSFTLNYGNNMSAEEFLNVTSRFIEHPVLPSGRSYTGSLTVVASSSLSSTIINDFYGQAGTSGPEDGSGDTSPLTDLEFKIELVNSNRYANIWLDQCVIDDISEPVDIGAGLRLLTFNFTAFYAKDNKPFRWWTV